MRILHVSQSALSNSPANLARIQRLAGHTVDVVLGSVRNTNGVHVGGISWVNLQTDQLTHMFEQADIIHMHNFAWEQAVFLQNPHLKTIALTKPCLIQFHSPRHTDHNFEHIIKDPFFRRRKAVLAQYQARQYPEAEHVVPNVLPLNDDLYTPLKQKPPLPLPLVSCSPSNTNLSGWDAKGSEQVSNIFRLLEQKHLARTEMITNTPYKETLLKKRWADLGLEEIVTGSYHLSYLEYMAQGVATICNMDDATRAAMAMVVGYDAVQDLPSIPATKYNLEDLLIRLVRNPDFLKERGRACRAWMETHWHPTKMERYFSDIYQRL